MRRNDLSHRIVFRNPSDRSDVVRIDPGGVYDDSPAWVAAAAADTGGQEVVVELDELTVPELRDMATERGVEVPADAKKADLVAALQ